MNYDFDVVIIGGGMVGSCLAALLGQTGGIEPLRVAVVEPQTPVEFDRKSELALRVSAVSRASQNILRAAGAWTLVSDERISPYREMRVWDADSKPFDSQSLHFDSADIGEPDLGHIVENNLMRWALVERVRAIRNVDWIDGASLTAAEFSPDVATVRLSNDRALRAKLVVGADGARSALRELAGIDVRGWGYDQKAVVSHLVTERPHEETAWQRFLQTGPIAFLPLADGRSSVVWSTTPAHADELLSLSKSDYHKALAVAGDRVLGDITDSGERAAFPLSLQHANRYVRDRCALIGDAAHSVHPLAGQGVNLGYLDAAALADVITGALKRGLDPGDRPVLRRYERWRKGENLLTMATLDGLKRLFGNRSPMAGYARRAGFELVNRMAPVKNTLIRRAMGLTGDLPRLAR